ncbi:MAG TPA: fumarylacetoacetate hydrolase family protein [Terriglobales bacterium]|jgi:fumarylpyruvate hydrolase|nr:fumarylacetoacetate hydrolase family protein [Terriglobales bacterium]
MNGRRAFLKTTGLIGAAGPFGLPSTRSSNEKVVIPAPPEATLPVAGTDGRFPVRRIYCVGRNYLAHIREMGHDEREAPFFFAKASDMIVQNGATITYPSLTQNYHHEIELVVAMKSGGTDIPVDGALGHVYGYAVGLDMTRRDLQQAAARKGQPWEIGKSFDQAAPCSAVFPFSKVGHLSKGKIQLTVNGEERQNSDLGMMIWNVQEIISHLSQQVGLAAGDLIYTGTPDGVGPVVRGDKMIGHIDGLGDLSITIA